MKIPSTRKLQQITFNHSSDIDFKDFIKIYKTGITGKYFFLVNDANLSSDNPKCFRRNLSEKNF